MSIRWARRKTKKILDWIMDYYEYILPATIVLAVMLGDLINGLITGHW